MKRNKGLSKESKESSMQFTWNMEDKQLGNFKNHRV